MDRPIIGVLGNTMRHLSSVYGEVEKQYVNEKYIFSVEKNGGIPVIIPQSGDPESVKAMVALCDGLLLPGGEDVDPSLYGEGPHRHLGESRPRHDRFFLEALRAAETLGLPCLGICKGMQIMAVYAGGTLYQDIYAQISGDVFLHCQHGGRDYPVHSVSIRESSRLRRLLGQERVSVNSMHHQSVRSLRGGLIESAWADDGVVEALESPDGLWIGVQWHPEELTETSESMNRLFADLAERAAKRRESK